MSIKSKADKVKSRITHVPSFEREDVKDELQSLSKTVKTQVSPQGLFSPKKPPATQNTSIVEAMLQTSEEPLKTVKGALQLEDEITVERRKREEATRKWLEDQDELMTHQKSGHKKYAGLPPSGKRQHGMSVPGDTPKNPEMMKKKG